MTSLFNKKWPLELVFESHQKETTDIHTFSFKPRGEINWEAGQYIEYRLGFGLKKHFTIANAPYEKIVKITTRIPEKPSKFKEKLLALKSGEIIVAKKPKGNLIIDNPNKEYVFIAGGIGITPFRAIIWDQVYKKRNYIINLLYANSDKNITFKKDLDLLSAENKNLKVNYFIEPKRITKENLPKTTPNGPLYLIAGPPKMVEAHEAILRKLKVPNKNIKTDSFWGY